MIVLNVLNNAIYVLVNLLKQKLETIVIYQVIIEDPDIQDVIIIIILIDIDP